MESIPRIKNPADAFQPIFNAVGGHIKIPRYLFHAIPVGVLDEDGFIKVVEGGFDGAVH
jgi:hypothetical protein